ncbi:MAG TPA: hypothetical protein VLA16_06665 [Ideonella sp.]|nr:hypothetical protein [Ideonella sp.]
MDSNKIKQVAVTVSETGQITCTPSQAVIKGSNVLLTFNLLTADYAFPSTGAVVVASGGSQFPYPCWTVDANTAVLFDVNTVVADYNYTITVVQIDSSDRLHMDPSIRNEG